MFNVGIVAARRNASLVKLTSRALKVHSDPEVGPSYFMFITGDGRLVFVSDAEGSVTIAGEWYAAVTSGIGGNYAVRGTLLAGYPMNYGNNITGWDPLTSGVQVGWYGGNGGRVLIEIRDQATLTIRASAQFWTPGYAP